MINLNNKGEIRPGSLQQRGVTDSELNWKNWNNKFDNSFVFGIARKSKRKSFAPEEPKYPQEAFDSGFPDIEPSF